MITQWSFCTNALLSSLLSDFPLSMYRSTLITEWYQEGRFQFYLCVANVNFNKVIHWFFVQIVYLLRVYIDLNVTCFLQWIWRFENDYSDLGMLNPTRRLSYKYYYHIEVNSAIISSCISLLWISFCIKKNVDVEIKTSWQILMFHQVSSWRVSFLWNEVLSKCLWIQDTNTLTNIGSCYKFWATQKLLLHFWARISIYCWSNNSQVYSIAR